MSEISETVLEIDLKSLEHNYTYLRSKLSKNTKMLGVVKAFAYGSDSVAIARKLENLGIDYLAVAYTQEGVRLRKAGIKKPILVLHPQSVNFQAVINHALTPCLYSNFVLDAFVEAVQQSEKKQYPVHLKLNTGLNRLGFAPAESAQLIEKLQQQSVLNVEGIFSHLAASEDLQEKAFTNYQLDTFTKTSTTIINGLGYRPLLHLCNTSGILNYPEAEFDMVRTGIGLYGYSNSEQEDQKLIPIATLKTLISQIHHVQKGDTVGYNRKFEAKKTTKTATLPLGHADGINRIYGNQKASVLVNGKLAPIIGNVCMDMLMIDITGIDCKEGDEVIIFGKNKSAERFAQQGGSISYELITAISQRVKRKVIE